MSISTSLEKLVKMMDVTMGVSVFVRYGHAFKTWKMHM